MSAKNWDEIDLGDLSMEGPTPAEPDPGKRPERHQAKKVAELNEEPDKAIEVTVYNLSSRREATGVILDIALGGLKVLTQLECRMDDALRVSFSLGSHRVSSQAKVRWVKWEEHGFVAGLSFVSLKKEDEALLNSLTSALYLK